MHESFDQYNTWIWSEFALLNSKDNITMSAGIDKDIVEICIRSGIIHCNSPELYSLILSIYDTPSVIDEEALDRLKVAVREHMDSNLAFYKGYTPNAEFYETEIVNFGLKSVFDDILNGKVYVYKLDFALLMKHPEYMPIEGGILMDSKFRMCCFDNKPFLMVVEINGEIKHTEYLGYDIYYGSEEDGEKNARIHISFAIEQWLAEVQDK